MSPPLVWGHLLILLLWGYDMVRTQAPLAPFSLGPDGLLGLGQTWLARALTHLGLHFWAKGPQGKKLPNNYPANSNRFGGNFSLSLPHCSLIWLAIIVPSSKSWPLFLGFAYMFCRNWPLPGPFVSYGAAQQCPFPLFWVCFNGYRQALDDVRYVLSVLMASGSSCHVPSLHPSCCV